MAETSAVSPRLTCGGQGELDSFFIPVHPRPSDPQQSLGNRVLKLMAGGERRVETLNRAFGVPWDQAWAQGLTVRCS